MNIFSFFIGRYSLPFFVGYLMGEAKITSSSSWFIWLIWVIIFLIVLSIHDYSIREGDKYFDEK